MLNITKNSLNEKVDITGYEAGRKVFHSKHFKYFNLFLKFFAAFGLIALFLPWTQTISSTGSVTTLSPDKRPQTIQSAIPGLFQLQFPFLTQSFKLSVKR